LAKNRAFLAANRLFCPENARFSRDSRGRLRAGGLQGPVGRLPQRGATAYSPFSHENGLLGFRRPELWSDPATMIMP